MRDSLAQEGEEADDERDVSRHRDAPPGYRRLTPLQRQVDSRGHDHSAEGGNDRQRRLAQRAQLPRDDFPFDFQPDDEEEEGHQPVIDPPQKWLAQSERANAKAERRLPKVGVLVRPDGVSDN